MNANKSIEKMLGSVMVIFVVVALTPEIFTQLGLLGTETPAWITTILQVVVGVGLVMLVYKVFL